MHKIEARGQIIQKNERLFAANLVLWFVQSVFYVLTAGLCAAHLFTVGYKMGEEDAPSACTGHYHLKKCGLLKKMAGARKEFTG